MLIASVMPLPEVMMKRQRRLRMRQIKISLWQADRPIVTDLDLAYDVMRNAATDDRFHVDGEAVIVPLWRRRNRVGAGVAHAAERNAHTHRLTGAMAAPVKAGLER